MRLPHLFAGRRIERRQILIVGLAREEIHAVADENRRGVADTDFNLPSLVEGFGPRFWRRERRRGAVAVWSAPLRPVGACPLLRARGHCPADERCGDEEEACM